MRRLVAVLGAVALLTTGCGGGNDEGSEPLGVATRVGGGPTGGGTCTTTPTDDPMPSFYPSGLTLPPGAVVTQSAERGPIATITGYVPGPLDAVFAKFRASIERAALPIEREDNEGFEAEYFFGTQTLQGVLRVVEEPCLPGKTVFAMSLHDRG